MYLLALIAPKAHKILESQPFLYSHTIIFRRSHFVCFIHQVSLILKFISQCISLYKLLVCGIKKWNSSCYIGGKRSSWQVVYTLRHVEMVKLEKNYPTAWLLGLIDWNGGGCKFRFNRLTHAMLNRNLSTHN